MVLSNTHLVIGDPHAHPDHNNDRAIWLSKLIVDVKPDVVVNIGDSADLSSLSSYDKGKASFISRNYERDIESHLDFQEKLWHNVRKSKKKLPRRVVLEGNHDHRIKKVLEYDPHLAGAKYGIGFSQLELNSFYDDVVEYDGGTPGIIKIDGINYAHYMISGVMGRPIGGEHHAHSLVNKNYESCTVGHSHTLDYCNRVTSTGTNVNGLVTGCFHDYIPSWAGNVGNLWWSGVCICRGVDNGKYDLEVISTKRMKEIYS